MKERNLTRWFADELLEVDYDKMSEEMLVETLTEHLHEGLPEDVRMDDKEWEKFNKHIAELVAELYDDAVELVDISNEQAEGWAEARREAEKGDY